MYFYPLCFIRVNKKNSKQNISVINYCKKLTRQRLAPSHPDRLWIPAKNRIETPSEINDLIGRRPSFMVAMVYSWTLVAPKLLSERQVKYKKSSIFFKNQSETFLIDNLTSFSSAWKCKIRNINSWKCRNVTLSRNIAKCVYDFIYILESLKIDNKISVLSWEAAQKFLILTYVLGLNDDIIF